MRRSLLAAVLAAALRWTGLQAQGRPQQPELRRHRAAPIEVYERSRQLIDAQKDTKQDREDAYALVFKQADTSPEYFFARAAVAGRLAENRGLQALGLVTETEDYARRGPRDRSRLS
jgi:hypothetical protein